MDYRLALPDSLRCMHDVIHVSVLCHYISNLSPVIDLILFQVLDEGALIAERIHILDHRTCQLRCRLVNQVKV